MTAARIRAQFPTSDGFGDQLKGCCRIKLRKFSCCENVSFREVRLSLLDHVPDWQPRILLGMVEARSVNVKKTTTMSLIAVQHNKYVGRGSRHRSELLLHFEEEEELLLI